MVVSGQTKICDCQLLSSERLNIIWLQRTATVNIFYLFAETERSQKQACLKYKTPKPSQYEIITQPVWGLNCEILCIFRNKVKICGSLLSPHSNCDSANISCDGEQAGHQTRHIQTQQVKGFPLFLPYIVVAATLLLWCCFTLKVL